MNILGSHMTYYERFWGGTKGEDREGSRCSGEEQAWEIEG